MILSVKILSGLPPYGPLATPFPANWGRTGREGFVVEFETDRGRWVGNFEFGPGNLRFAGHHPNRRDGLVIADGDLWIVSGDHHSAERVCEGINVLRAVGDPEGWIFERDGLAFVRWSPAGQLWHTRRISWDGFADIQIDRSRIAGMAWSAIDDNWWPFEVDLRTGKTMGGGYYDEDVEGWEQLHLG